MDNKFVRRSGVFLVVMSWILALLSVTALTLMILGIVIPDFLHSTWFIVALGEFLLPLQMLINPEESNGGVFIAIIVALIILSILAIVFVKKTYSYRSHNKKVSRVVSIIISAILFLYAGFSVVVLVINYQIINMAVGTLIYAMLGQNPGVLTTIVMIKYILICTLVMLSTILVFIAFMLIKGNETTYKDMQFSNVNFYSDEYEERISVEKQEEEKDEQVQEQKPQTKQRSKELINKIMQLNELKDNGQISDVEYTKLRQKAIKRYKV